jgi:Amt family ammonium transporter
VCAVILAKVIDMTMGFRVTEDEEVTGVDQILHAETAYDFAGVGSRSAGLGLEREADASPSKKVDA